jgi:putative phosphoesterase
MLPALVHQSPTMRLAVISDIHGNLLALEAVLADIARRGVDQIINCGDLCTSPLWPRETFQLLEARGIPSVRGNHDRWMATLPIERMSPALLYTRAALSETQHSALGALPPTRMMADDVLVCHGTPTDDYMFLLEDKLDGRLALARPRDIAERLGPTTASLVLCGHSHHPHMVQLPGGPLVVNPGSVGCPLFADNPAAVNNDARAPHAMYAILTKAKGRWSTEFIALDYDWDAAANKAATGGFPAWARAYATGAV